MTELNELKDIYFTTKLAELSLKLWEEEKKAMDSGESMDSLRERLKYEYEERDLLLRFLD